MDTTTLVKLLTLCLLFTGCVSVPENPENGCLALIKDNCPEPLITHNEDWTFEDSMTYRDAIKQCRERFPDRSPCIHMFRKTVLEDGSIRYQVICGARTYRNKPYEL